MSTLDDLRREFEDGTRQKGGTTCPCCGKHGQRYRRPISGAMAKFLIVFVRNSERVREREGLSAFKWIELGKTTDKFQNITRDYSKLRFWDLVEPHPDNPNDPTGMRKSKGLWRPKELGVEFVHRRVTVVRWWWEWRSEREYSEGPQVTIDDCLGKKFNYRALMRGEW